MPPEAPGPRGRNFKRPSLHTAPRHISRAGGLGLIPLVALATLAGGAAHGAERVNERVKMVDNSREAGMQDCVHRAAMAACGDAVLGAGAEDFLSRDIGRMPGRGCANGRCGMEADGGGIPHHVGTPCTHVSIMPES